MTEIDYYFSSASPFTYLGHTAIQEIAKKHGCKLNVRPVNIFEIWAESGAVPPAKRPPVRQRMRLIELQRLSLHRNLPLNKQPEHFPVDATLADLTIIAVIEAGGDPFSYMKSVFTGVWVNERDIADATTLAGLLSEAGHDADAILTAAHSDKAAAIRSANSTAAIKADAPGVPAYVLNGECFWGQDRITYIDEALTSGRAPFTSL